MTPYYRAWCKHCGCTVKTGESSTFMSAFFLPERCPGCHRYHSRHGYSPSLYERSYGFWKFVPDDPQPPKPWWAFWRGRAGKNVWTPWTEPTLGEHQ